MDLRELSPEARAVRSREVSVSPPKRGSPERLANVEGEDRAGEERRRPSVPPNVAVLLTGVEMAIAQVGDEELAKQQPSFAQPTMSRTQAALPLTVLCFSRCFAVQALASQDGGRLV